MKMSRLEDGLRVALSLAEARNRRDASAITRLCSADCVLEHYSPAPDGATYAGADAISRFLQNEFAANPTAQLKVEDVHGMGLRCELRWRMEWTDTTGNLAHLRGVDLFEFRGGQICKWWSYAKN